jgi:rod shape-determining protein MreC
MSSSRDDFGIAIRSALLQRGAKQKFSLFFFIILSISIFFLDNFPNKIMDSFRTILNDGIYRTSSIATFPFTFVSYLTGKTKSHFLTYEENKILKQELKDLKNKDFHVNFLLTENKNLQKIVESNSTMLEDMVLGKVLLDKQSPFLKSIIINKGKKSGVQKGMPVVEGNQLVGRTVEVNYLSSRVLLLNDLNSRIPVVIESSTAQAILTGHGEKRPRLEYLPELFEPQEGQTVFTSGKDGIFSAGIAVGKITLENGIVEVQLFSDPNQLSFISIVLTNLNME